MKIRALAMSGWLFLVIVLPTPALAAKLRAETLRAWEQYRTLTEARIERELASSEGFLIRDFLDESDITAIRSSLADGNIFVKKFATINEEGGNIKIPKGLLHHWYGIVFLPGAKLDEVLAWEQDYDNHEIYFEEVEDSRLVSRQGDTFDIFLRLRRKKVITVHYNTEHRVSYRRIGEDTATSHSESTRIAELENPGTDREREKPLENDRGFMWRLNSYWRFQQTSEGVFVECESISLSRTIPVAFRWVVKPFINSVPRESLEATLRPLRDAFAEVGKVEADTLRAWEEYIRLTEARIEREIASDKGFPVADFLQASDAASLRRRP